MLPNGWGQDEPTLTVGPMYRTLITPLRPFSLRSDSFCWSKTHALRFQTRKSLNINTVWTLPTCRKAVESISAVPNDLKVEWRQCCLFLTARCPCLRSWLLECFWSFLVDHYIESLSPDRCVCLELGMVKKIPATMTQKLSPERPIPHFQLLGWRPANAWPSSLLR